MNIEIILKKIFPPLNEITVFIFTATLYSLFIYMDGWFIKAIELSISFFNDFVYSIINAPTLTDMIFGGIFPLLLFPLLTIAIIVGPLFLPFTKSDLRFLCIFIILIDASIIALFNSLSLSSNLKTTKMIIPIYSIAWIIYILAVIRITKRIDFIMNDTQTTVNESCIAAAISIFLVFIAIKVFSIKWFIAYSIVTISVATAIPSFYKVYKNEI